MRASSARPKGPRPTLTRRGIVAFEVISLSSVLAASSAPTPLYRIYQEHWAFPPVMVTAIFAVYAFSLLLALLTVGGLSDYVGRRPVIFASLLGNTLAMLVFATADSVTGLICARLLQGYATGSAASSLGAAILDADKARGPLINSVAPIAGIGFGALGSGALVSYAPAPEHLVYIILIAVFVSQAMMLRWIPETVTKQPGALASLKPRVSLPEYARAAFILVVPSNIAIWSLLGFYLSLMPSLLRIVIASASPLFGGAIVTTLTFAATAGIVLVRHWHAMPILVRSAWALIFGVAITLWGVRMQYIALLLAGTVVAGFGFGPTFFGGIRTIMPLASPSERAGLLSTIYILSYLSLSVPTIVAGLAVPTLGLPTTTYIYGGAVMSLTLASFIATLASIRRTRITSHDGDVKNHSAPS
jgi:MFS family permease